MKRTLISSVAIGILVLVTVLGQSPEYSIYNPWFKRQSSELELSSVASSYSGEYVVFSSNEGLMVSSNFATNWSAPAFPVDIDISNGFSKVTCDNSCKRIYAVGPFQTPIVSLDYGVSWSALLSLPSDHQWTSIVCNDDCTVLYAVASDVETVFMSTDSAASFIQSVSIGLNLTDIDCSSDGSMVVVAQYGGGLYHSSDFGQSWILGFGSGIAKWNSVTVSGDGQYVAACAWIGFFVTSSNYGANYTFPLEIQELWSSISSDVTGQYLVAVCLNAVFQSGDYGQRWTSQQMNEVYSKQAVAVSSGNGQMLYGAMSGEGSFISNRSATFPLPQSEFDALLDLYNATNGPEWTYKWYDIESANVYTPCQMSWYGLFCSYDETYSHVDTLYFFTNNMVGSLPDSIGAFTELTQFMFQGNPLTGTIPNSVGQLTKTTMFEITLSNMWGPIPPSVSGMKALETFILYSNYFSNPIPVDSFAQLEMMSELSLQYNNFNGSLIDFTLLKQLTHLYLTANDYSGSIPDSLWEMTQLNALELGSNRLTGSISNRIVNLKEMQTLNLNDNHLNGTIPKFIGNLSLLTMLYLNNNELSGSIPESLSNCIGMTTLYLSQNYLTGSIPPEFANMSHLVVFYIDSNRLTGHLPHLPVYGGGYQFSLNYFSGPLPPVWSPTLFNISFNAFTGSIPELTANTSTVIMFNNNFLTGTLPEMLCMHHCSQLSIGYNQLTGPLPGQMILQSSLLINSNYLTGLIPSGKDWSAVKYFVMSDNLLSGTIPQSVTVWDAVDIYLDNNLLSGTLPTDLFQLPSLFSLLLNRNKFTGNLNELIDASLDPSQSVLVNVDVSDNQFSGSIPGSIFEVVTLQSFAANSNCMDGSIPGEVCGALNLTTLLLDGVVAASACQTKYRSLVSGSSIYVAEKSLSGGVPECLFHLPKLATLHLSGNGLSGRVPPMVSLTDQSSASSAALSNSLTELSLSYNRLTGRIPESIQMYPWSSLDLSYNRLDGDLMSGGFHSGGVSGGSQRSVSLQVNRLSGEVPVGLVESSGDVNVLDGNMFHCNINKNQIPSRDPNYGSYECGSYSFDVSAILWGCAQLFPVSCLIYLLAVKGGSIWDVSERTELRDKHLAHLDNYVLVSGLSVRVRQSIVVVMGFITCIVLPVCAVLSLKYDSYEYEYSWSASGIYMSGVVPAVVLLVLLIVLLVILKWSTARIIRIDPSRSSEKTVAMDAVVSTSRPKEMVMIACIVLLNAIVLLGVNVAYVVIANRSSTSAVFVTQLCMAYFKLTWNRFFVLKALSNLVRYYPESKGLVGRWMVTIELCMMVFNNMMAPFVAVALVDANCFKDVIVAPPEVKSEYYASLCSAVINYEKDGKLVSQCSVYSEVLQQSSFAPPFTYSYQCSSSYIALYSNIFVLMFTSTAVLVPLRNELSRWCMSRCDVGSVWWHVANVFCSRLACPPSSLLFLRHSIPPRDAHFIRLLRVLAGKIETLFKANVFVVDITSMLVIILTFGTVVPLIGIIGCISVCCYTYYAQHCIVRFANECDKCKTENVTVYFTKMNSQFHLVQDQLSHVMSIIVPWMCVFYAFLLFDTMGSAVGAMRAMWLPVGLVCGLLLVGGVSRLWRDWSGDRRVQRARMYKPLIENSNMSSVVGSEVESGSSDVANAMHDEI